MKQKKRKFSKELLFWIWMYAICFSIMFIDRSRILKMMGVSDWGLLTYLAIWLAPTVLGWILRYLSEVIDPKGRGNYPKGYEIAFSLCPIFNIGYVVWMACKCLGGVGMLLLRWGIGKCVDTM